MTTTARWDGRTPGSELPPQGRRPSRHPRPWGAQTTFGGKPIPGTPHGNARVSVTGKTVLSTAQTSGYRVSSSWQIKVHSRSRSRCPISVCNSRRTT